MVLETEKAQADIMSSLSEVDAVRFARRVAFCVAGPRNQQTKGVRRSRRAPFVFQLADLSRSLSHAEAVPGPTTA